VLIGAVQPLADAPDVYASPNRMPGRTIIRV
jgi:hypothetical protein